MGLPKAEIARHLRRHRSTIYRALDRNSNAPGHRPDGADRLAWALKVDVRSRDDDLPLTCLGRFPPA
jgi:IS30 family transposase